MNYTELPDKMRRTIRYHRHYMNVMRRRQKARKTRPSDIKK